MGMHISRALLNAVFAESRGSLERLQKIEGKILNLMAGFKTEKNRAHRPVAWSLVSSLGSTE